MSPKWTLIACYIAISACSRAAGPELQPPALEAIPHAHFRFEGVVGDRVDANAQNWLLRAPEANPALLEMFAMRDRKPTPDLVDWAGEFVGKYLISGVQALRMSDAPRLRKTLENVVARLLELQAEDGYLGPWPKDQRLLGHWDLWGHYHVMLGLMMWHEHTGDERALAAARSMADLACKIYLGGARKMKEAGSPEMNMSVLHGLTLLYERTGEPQYLRLCEQIVQELETAGDYLRTGLKGIEFFKTPKPRWESLHALQGLMEMWRITGDERYRRAFLHHHASIRRFDVHNTGAFSSGEQATGNPYSEGAIETCCTIAWTAVMIDALRLTGDPQIADDLELTFYNAVCAAQHPSGFWWTYDTPMNGRRAASQHSIVFQSRPGSPELNCCSVNGPRGLGMLSEWAVMLGSNRVVVNYLGPFEASFKMAGKPVTLRVQGDYPLGTNITIHVTADEAAPFTLAVRYPAWAKRRKATYMEVSRTWKNAEITLPVWREVGDREQAGKISVYRGPVLLAWDQAFNIADAPGLINSLDLNSITPATSPWLLAEINGAKLCDYASAGASGTRYWTWLPGTNLPPPAPAPLKPRDGEKVARGALEFAWRGMHDRSTRVVASIRERGREVLRWTNSGTSSMAIPEQESNRLKPGVPYEFKVIAHNQHGESQSLGTRHFVIDESIPRANPGRNDRALVIASLKGNPNPQYGKLGPAIGWKPVGDAIETNGKLDSMLTYDIDQFPESDYTVAVRVMPLQLPEKRLGQIFSGWAKGSDDPLRLVIDRGKLYARIEAGQGASTEGVPIDTGNWHYVVAVKAGDQLTLFLDGKAMAQAKAPGEISSQSTRVALGGNPLYRGANESLAARFKDFQFYGRALSVDEIRELAHARR